MKKFNKDNRVSYEIFDEQQTKEYLYEKGLKLFNKTITKSGFVRIGAGGIKFPISKLPSQVYMKGDNFYIKPRIEIIYSNNDKEIIYFNSINEVNRFVKSEFTARGWQ